MTRGLIECCLLNELIIDGMVYNHDRSKTHQNREETSETDQNGEGNPPTKTWKHVEVKEGDEWSMEVDLRSEEKEMRALHWFVRGKQLTGFITGLPPQVRFGVCLSFLSIFFSYSSSTPLYSGLHTA